MLYTQIERRKTMLRWQWSHINLRDHYQPYVHTRKNGHHKLPTQIWNSYGVLSGGAIMVKMAIGLEKTL